METQNDVIAAVYTRRRKFPASTATRMRTNRLYYWSYWTVAR